MSQIHVAVGVIQDADGRVLITRRSARQHLGGFWEFPGGKVEAAETVQHCLARELQEELGIMIDPNHVQPLCLVEHDYGDKKVLLDVWRITRYRGTPTGLEGQPLRWVAINALQAEEFPAANRVIIRNLQLPPCIAIVDIHPDTTPAAIGNWHSDCLVRLRAGWPELASPPVCETQRAAIGHAYLQRAVAELERLTPHAAGTLLDLAPLLAHSPTTIAQLAAQHPSFRGVHCNRWALTDPRTVPWLTAAKEHWQLLTDGQLLADRQLLIGASCHNKGELQAATQVGADFALLSPVQATRSHPDTRPLGWPGFAELVAQTRLPVYALGGMTMADLTTAQAAGARGIAGISLFQARDQLR